MKKQRITSILFVAGSLVLVALYASAQPTVGISKRLPLSGNGTTSSPLQINGCGSSSGQVQVWDGSAYVCGANGTTYPGFSCGSGSAAQASTGSGSATCVAVGAGTVTGVYGGSGMTGSANAGSGTLDVVCLPGLRCNADSIQIDDRDFGDFTTSGSGSSATVDNGAITLAKMANLTAATVIGRAIGAGTGVPTALSQTQLTALINTVTATLSGAVPAPGTSSGVKYLRDDFTWVTPTDTNTTYSAGTSLSLTGTTFALNEPTTSCGAGNFVQSKTATGTDTCAAEVGDVSSVQTTGQGVTNATCSSGACTVALGDSVQSFTSTGTFTPSFANVTTIDATTASQTLQGIAAPGSGAATYKIVNSSAGSVTIANQNGTATAVNRIVTGTGADVTLAAGASTWVAYSSNDSRYHLQAGGGGGGGITNSAGNNVVMKSNGTNAVASAATDTGSVFTIGETTNINGLVTITGTAVGNTVAQTVQLVASGAVGDENLNYFHATGTLDATAASRGSYGAYSDVKTTRSAGANTVSNFGFFADVSGAQSNYSFYGLNGEMHNQGAITAGGNINGGAGISATTFVTSGTFLQTAGSSVAGHGIYAGNNSDAFLSTISNQGSLGFAYATNGAATGKINSVGYNEGTTQFRSLEIDDGKGALVASFNGATKDLALAGGIAVTNLADLASQVNVWGILKGKGTFAPGTGSWSCGTSPTVTGNMWAFNVGVGSGTVTSCVVNGLGFSSTHPTCSVTGDKRSGFYISAHSATSITITTSTAANLAGDTLDVICVDH